MNNRTLFPIALVLVSCVGLTPVTVNSQTTVTMISLQTVTTEMNQTSVSQSTMTYTATFDKGQVIASNISLYLWPSNPGGCHYGNLPFLATKGQQIFAHLGATAPIDFFLLTEGSFQSWLKSGSCAVSNAILSQYNVYEFNPALEPIVIPANGAYEFLFVNTANSPAPVSFNSNVAVIYSVQVQQASTVSVLITSTELATHGSVGNSLTNIPGFQTSTNTLESSSTFAYGSQSSSVVGTSSMVLASTPSSTVLTPTYSQPSLFTNISLNWVGLLTGFGAIVAIATLSTVLVGRRKRRTRATDGLSTGYADFDELLGGGLPLGYAVLIISPPCDERDLLLQRLIHSTISSQGTAFLVTSDTSKAQDLVSKYEHGLYAYSATGKSIASAQPNLIGIPTIENLSEFNIVLNQNLTKTSSENRKIIIIDLLSDILLHYKSITTRKWLSEFIARRKDKQFTIVATLNPYLAKEDAQVAILDLFDAILEIYEKKLREKSRRFLTVKKMYGRRYAQTDIMLDPDKLWTEKS